MHAMAPRLFAGDEELGKRDDEYRPGKRTSIGAWKLWQQKRIQHGPIRRSLKRLGMLILGLFAIYLFIHNIPTDLKPPRSRPSYNQNGPKKSHPSRPPANSGTPGKASAGAHSGTSKHTKDKDEVAHDFSGPIKFYDLAVSLHAVAATQGAGAINRNVVSGSEAHSKVPSLIIV